MFGEFSCVEVDGGYNELYFRQNIGSLAGELARRCRQALLRRRESLPMENCAVELAVEGLVMRAQPGARLPLEVSVKNVGKAAIGGTFSGLRLGGSWISNGAAVGARFVEAAPLPALGPGDVSIVKIFPSAPENEGNFELVLDLFEERGCSLTELNATRFCATVKVTHRAMPIRESLRSYFPRRKPIVA
jgi:hypothetical protein